MPEQPRWTVEFRARGRTTRGEVSETDSFLKARDMLTKHGFEGDYIGLYASDGDLVAEGHPKNPIPLPTSAA